MEAALLLFVLDVSALGEVAAAVELIAGVIALFGGAEYQFVAASGAAQGSLCGFGCSDGDLLFGNGCGGLHGLGGLGAHGLLNVRNMFFLSGGVDLRVGVKLVIDGLDLLRGQGVMTAAPDRIHNIAYLVAVDDKNIRTDDVDLFQGASVGEGDDGMHGDGFAQQYFQMLDVGAVLHDGIVEGFLVALALTLRKGLVPLGLVLAAKDPAAVIFAFKHEQALSGDHQNIDFRRAVLTLGDVDVEQEFSAVLLVPAQMAVGQIFAVPTHIQASPPVGNMGDLVIGGLSVVHFQNHADDEIG